MTFNAITIHIHNLLLFFFSLTSLLTLSLSQSPSSCGPSDPLVCPSIGNYLYDGCNCAPGFWCGCSSSNESQCDPLAINTQWRGVTVLDNGDLYPADAETQDMYRCPDTFFCPGMNQTETCPGLCPEGFYCPTPNQVVECPQAMYCPLGTVVPITCPPLSKACGKGTKLFDQLPALILSLTLAVVSALGLFFASWIYKKKLATPVDKLSEQDKDLQLDYSFESSNIIPKENRINFEFDNLRLELKDGPCILAGVTGKLLSGQLTAVMGPSGAGKTTFLSVLSGKVDRTDGSLLINGKPDEIYNHRRVVGFVPQEDIMYRDLTVYENIILNAKLRLPKDWQWDKKKAFVDHVIRVLGLEHIKNSIVGDENKRGISGGQRKRVNIAMELVANPTVLYLDEPTSGLDSTSSSVVIEALKDAASRGVNCVSVLHQPKYEIYSMFDQLLLLGVGGRTVFMGSPRDAERYFKEQGFECPPYVNPADFFMDVIAGLVPKKGDPSFRKEDLFDMWNERTAVIKPVNVDETALVVDEHTQDNNDTGCCTSGSHFFTRHYDDCKGAIRHMLKSDPSKAVRETDGFVGQFIAFYIRAWQRRLHHPLSTIIFMSACTLASVVLASAFVKTTIYQGIPIALTQEDTIWYQLAILNYTVQNSVAYLVLFLWVIALLIAATAGVTMFGYHRVQFFREMSAGMSTSAYFCAVWAEEFPWLIINTLLFAGFFQGILNMRQGFGSIFVLSLCVFYGFYSMGILASILISRENMNVVAIISSLIMAVLFTGSTPKIGSISTGIKWIWYLTFTYWTASGFSTAEYQQYQPPYDVQLLNDINNPWGNIYGVGFDLFHYSMNLALGYLTAFVLSMITLVIMKVKDYKRQR